MSDAPAKDTYPQDMKLLVLSGIAGIALGWFAATSDYSPIKPEPDRPILRLLARVAKIGLWALMFAEQPPQQQQLVHARIDEHGHRVLNHSEGW